MPQQEMFFSASSLTKTGLSRLEVNAAEVLDLTITERVCRDEREADEAHSRSILKQSWTRVVEDRATATGLASSRAEERCYRRFERREVAVSSADAAQEAIERLNGRTQWKAEAEAYAIHVAASEGRRLAREQREADFRKARVFINGNELRGREDFVSQEAKKWASIVDGVARGAVEAEQRAKERYLNSDEYKQAVAERERKIAEAEALEIKKQNDFRREQAKLVNRCTHSRSGSSVFVGPLAKKMCLICKVKWDDAANCYIKMP